MRYDFQRASMMKRAPAWLLDMILLIVLATGFIAGLAHILNWDAQTAAMDSVYVRYEQEFGIDFTKTDEDFAKMSEEELAKYQAAAEAMSKDEEAQRIYEMYVNLSLVIMSVGVLLAFLVLELVVPLLFKNGQTLGKKCFGIALMRKDGIKCTPFMIFTRGILGKYTVETMIPLLMLMGTILVQPRLETTILCLAFLLAQVIVPMVTRNKTALHDLIACTVAVDMSSQMIFESVEEMEAYEAEILARANAEDSAN